MTKFHLNDRVQIFDPETSIYNGIRGIVTEIDEKHQPTVYFVCDERSRTDSRWQMEIHLIKVGQL